MEENLTKSATEEIEQGNRFAFGANWRAFLETLDDERIDEACRSLKELLGVDSLDGKRFADIGSGSGLFSLAARKLGAEVYSFDFDPQSVECTKLLRERYFSSSDEKWKIEQGSVLDLNFLQRLGEFDVAYSWGVLHHTGEMWKALENALLVVKAESGSILTIAIYNDESWKSRWWRRVKKLYCSSLLGRVAVKAVYYPWFLFWILAGSTVKHKNPFAHFSEYKRQRGMSVAHDWDDWLGGYPFEVPKPESLLDFYRSKGFELVKLISTNSLGCNQLVFKRK